MAYTSRTGRRPNEYASKSSHSNIVNDLAVKDFLETCHRPMNAEEVEIPASIVHEFTPLKTNPIQHVIAIDGSYTEVVVEPRFPSSALTFFQSGANTFSISDLKEIGHKPFIDPTDMAKLNDIQRFKYVLPTRNIHLKGAGSLITSVRKSLFNFFGSPGGGDNFLESLKWLLYQEYSKQPLEEVVFGNCPECAKDRVPLSRSKISSEFTFNCPHCSKTIYLTDVFRIHEKVDNEIGAGGALAYITNLIEHALLIHYLRVLHDQVPKLLSEILFIKDGPLAFFGQTAQMFKPMRSLITYLSSKQLVSVVGIEKSGPFVEHAHEIREKIRPKTFILLDNEYITRYVIAGRNETSDPYGRINYYGTKVIFRPDETRLYVLTIPTKQFTPNPSLSDLIGLDGILTNLAFLYCDMYDSSLVPIALVNKLVSLANHPSSAILEKFAKSRVNTH